MRRVKEPTGNRLQSGTLAAALALVTFALYAPALRHGFLLYDDQQYVTENLQVQAGLSWAGILWAFKSFYATNWHPLTWLSHMLDCQVYGLRPWGHHLTSVLLHAAATVLLFVALRRLTGALWRSAIVAALFGWHPAHVESVAWIAERKDVLSGLFWMLTLLAYAKYVELRRAQDGTGPAPPRSSRRGMFCYLLTIVLFGLGLLSKPMVVTLPMVLLLLDYWPLNRMRQGYILRLVLEKVPLLILSAGSCALTLMAQQQAMVSRRGLGWVERVWHAVLAYGHYFWSLLWPQKLAVFYPYQKHLPAGELLVAAVLLVAFTVLAAARLRRWPFLAVGWCWFLGVLVPVIGLVQVGEQAWADRYTYLPSVGLFIMIVWGAWEAACRFRAIRVALPWLGAAAGVAMVAGTAVQLSYWKNTRTLFERADSVTSANPLSATILGSLLASEGHYEEAIVRYNQALGWSPGFPQALFHLGHAFEKQGKLKEAEAAYEKALWFKPLREETHIRLGVVLSGENKIDAAAAHYEEALRLNPDSAVAHNNLAKLRHHQGRRDEAILHYRAALKAEPRLPEAHNNLGVLLLQTGRTAEGISELREALRLKPEDAETRINLAQGLAEGGKWPEAADLFAKAVTPATADPNVRYQFADSLFHAGRTREAVSQYAAALLLQPDFPEALDGLSWILSTDPDPQLRNGAEAVRMAERACYLTARKDALKLRTLAAAYAAAGRFAEAGNTAQEAAETASANGQRGLLEQCRAMQRNFASGKPWTRE